MGTLKFDDGVQFNTDGPYRIIRKHDGLYLVGHGMLCPVDSREQGESMIESLNEKENE